MNIKGALVAASVAGLFATLAPVVASADKAGDEVKCSGINACKGQGGCQTATNACAGKNDCKQKAWIKSSADDCKKKGGKVVTASAK